MLTESVTHLSISSNVASQLSQSSLACFFLGALEKRFANFITIEIIDTFGLGKGRFY